METVSEARGASHFRLVPMAVALVAMFVGLVWASTASATSDPLASGSTSLHLKRGFKKKLSNIDVNLQKWGSGKANNSKVDVLVNGGSLDPTNGQGTVDNGGGFKFKHGKRTVPITEIEVNTANRSVFAKVANARMKFGFLAGTMSYSRDGFGTIVKSTKLKLTGKAAKRINNKLGMSKQQPLNGGRVMSNAYSATQPTTVTVVPGGDATLLTNIRTVGKFVSVGVDFVPIAPATEKLALPPSFFFPIGGGTIAPDASGGTVQTLGGVKLLQREFAPGLQLSMTLSSIWIDLNTKVATAEVSIDSTDQARVPTPGNVGRSSIANLDLSGATISSDPTNHTVTILNATATLQAVTAATLNSIFAEPILRMRDVFVEGDPLGPFSFTAQTQ